MITAAPRRLNAPKYLLSQTKKNWSSAPLPDEAARLKVLYQCNILDTPPEKEFDEIAQLAALICGTPIALISFMDFNRQCFKSNVGWEKISIKRDFAFCAHTIEQKDILLVPNTLTDERFATNPLVTSEPHIQFYAGVPLITFDNQALGTLCVIDRVPRELNSQQVEALHTLSCQVVKLLELRRKATIAKPLESKQQQSARKSKHFFTRMAAGLGLASAILVGVGLVSYRSLTNLAHNDDWQIQHYQVLENLKDLDFLIQKAKIAKNRYVSTRQARYLESYGDAAKQTDLKIALLKQETINNPHQQRRLATLEPLIKKNIQIEQKTN